MKGALVCGLALTSLAWSQDKPDIKERDLSVVRLGSAEALGKPVTVPRGYAVVIGISTYKNLDPKDNLPFAEKDAENLYSVLISKEGGNIEWENVVKLVGPQATTERIRETLDEWLPSKATENDRVIVFYAGHGLADSGGRGYLAPYDFDAAHFTETTYPMERLGQVLSKQVKARWKVLFTDACHSGKITTDSSVEQVNESFAKLPRAFLTLTSSRESESSYEDLALAGGNGVFSYFLVKGWQGEADTDPADGIVTADELVEYVQREVRAYARKQGRRQNPSDRGDYPNDLILGFSPQRRQQMIASLPQLANGTLVVEVNLDNVEIYVGEQRYGAASQGVPLRVPGLASGIHQVKGVRMGYEPVTVEVNIVPGATQTISLRLLHQRIVKPAAKSLYDEGERIWRRSSASAADLKKAADLLRRALKEEPSFSAAALTLCQVQQAQGLTSEAVASCRKASQIDADYVEARTMLGAVLMESGDYAEAVRQLQGATLQDAKNPFAHSLLAEALFLADRPAEAEQAATRSIELDNSKAQGFLLRGEARRMLGRLEEAIEDYRRALDLQQFDSGRLRTFAYFAVGTGMTKNRSGYRALYRSQQAGANYGLCACELGRQNFLRAIQLCNRVREIDKQDTDAMILLAVCYQNLFNRDNRRDYLVSAKGNLEEVLRLNPNVAKAAQLRASLREINEWLPLVH